MIVKYNNKVVSNNGKWVNYTYVDPYNPLNLPANTVRVRTRDGNAPIKFIYTRYETATLVAGTTDVYDVYKSGNDLIDMFSNSTNVIEILGANTTNITYMSDMFGGCTSLTSVPLFDTTNVTNMGGMFGGCTSLTVVPLFDTTNVTNMDSMFFKCTSLTSVPLFDTTNVTNMGGMFRDCTALTNVPLFDTSKATDVSYMFLGCYNVQSGALALYNQMSTQTRPPSDHGHTFKDCGRDTTTGAAELAQIPSDWGGEQWSSNKL